MQSSSTTRVERDLRVIRLFKWTGLIVSIVILLTWISSTIWGVNYEFVKSNVAGVITFGDGELGWMTLKGLNASSNPKGFSVERINGNRVWGLELPSIKRDDFYGEDNMLWVTIPLWLPFVIVAAPTAFLWHIDRRRKHQGHCPKCGYDLLGNQSGVCPECGTTIQVKRKMRTF